MKFVKNNLSFFIALGGVLFFLYTILFLLTHPVYFTAIIVNLPYVLTIMSLSLVPLIVVRRLNWSPEAAPLYVWALLFLTTAFYYSLSQGPNIIGFLLDMVTLKMTSSIFLSTFYRSATIAGIFILFYFVMAYVSGKKDDLFCARVDVKSYTIWIITYVIYLNTLISLVNPVFRRAF